MTWGWHLVLDCKQCNDGVKAAYAIRSFVDDLVEQIDMKAYGKPQIVHFATHDPQKGGYSLVQLIETSAITGHFVDLTGDAYLDVFSCKPFSEHTVIDVVMKHFNPQEIYPVMLERSAR